MSVHKSYGCVIICLLSSIVWAEEQQENVHALLKMSLEELMDIQVTAPSRRGENQLLASGVISVITAQEIREFGARHLRDVFDRIVSTQTIGSHLFPHSKVSLRAENASQSDNSILLLLNGRPIRNAMSGAMNTDLYAGFPLDIIHHIEIIRGPGSVIYGTNATAGVINIVTFNQEQPTNQSQVNLNVGSFGRQQLQLSTNLRANDYKLAIGGNLVKAEGDDFTGITDDDGHKETYQTGEENADLVVSGNYKGFSFNTLITNSVLDSAPAFFQLPSKSSRVKRNFLDVGYQFDVTDVWQASLNYTLSRSEVNWMIYNDNKSLAKSNGGEQLFEITLQGQPLKDFNVLLGVNHTILSKLPESDPRIRRRSAFIQADYLFSEKQKFIAGLQWNKPEESEGDLSPRVGFIQGIGERWWLKFLYSKAFRSPFLVELFADAPALLGNPKLKPEKVATTDVQLIYQTPTQYFGLTFYQSIFTDIISQTVLPNSPRVVQVNKGKMDFYGVEFEGKLALSDDLTLVGNASYQHNKDDKGIEDNTFVPNVTAKLGFTYTGTPGVTIGVFNSYFGEAPDLSKTLGNPALNPKAEAYNLLTANILLDTGKLWGVGEPDYSFISLYFDNLLNEAIYTPDLNHRRRNNTIPNHWGLGVYLGYQYRF